MRMNKVLTCGVPSDLVTKKRPHEVRTLLYGLIQRGLGEMSKGVTYEGYTSVVRFRVDDDFYNTIKENAQDANMSMVEYTSIVLSRVV